jgi:hypothetical protein
MLRGPWRRWTDSVSADKRSPANSQRQHPEEVIDVTGMVSASEGPVHQTSVSSAIRQVTGLLNAPSAEAEAPVETARETMTEKRAAASSVETAVISLESAVEEEEEEVAVEVAALMAQTAEEDVVTQEIGEDAPLPAESTAEDALALARVAATEDAEATLQEATNQEEIAATEEVEALLRHALVRNNAVEEATHRERVRAELLRRGEEATDLARDLGPSREVEALTAEKRETREVFLLELATTRRLAPTKSLMAFNKIKILKTRMILRSQMPLTMIETDLRQNVLNEVSTN